MPATLERRVTLTAVSPREASYVTGLSEKTVNQAIDRKEVDTLPARRKGENERLIGFPELIYLSLRDRVGPLLSAEGKRKLRQQLDRLQASPHPGGVSMGPLHLSIAGDIDAVVEKLSQVERANSFVISDPDVRAGEPVVRGTRITVAMLADLARQGAPREELLEDYPALTEESLDAALLFARLYPRRGRPRRAPFRDGEVIRPGK